MINDNDNTTSLAGGDDDTDIEMNYTELQVQTSVAMYDDANLYTLLLSPRPEELVVTKWGWNILVFLLPAYVLTIASIILSFDPPLIFMIGSDVDDDLHLWFIGSLCFLVISLILALTINPREFAKHNMED